MPVEIHRLVGRSPREEEAGDRFVKSASDGTVFHLTAWKRVVEEVFRHTPYYLLAVEGGDVCGVLPLFEVRGLRAGHVLVSVPYGIYGGLCAIDPVARAALLDEARRLAEQQRVRYMELRHLYGPVPGLPTNSVFTTFAKALAPDPEANFAVIPRKKRRMIRQGILHGLEGRRGWEPLPEFYEIYAISRWRLGSPLFPRRLFRAIRDHLGPDAQLLTIWHHGRMVGGVISFFYQDRVMPYYGAVLPEAFSLGVSDFMYWELIRESCAAGYRVFDFGQSHAGSGTYNFKRHWGFEPEPLAYQYMVFKGGGRLDVGPSTSYPRWLAEAWKHLPLPVTKLVGPALTRWLPLH